MSTSYGIDSSQIPDNEPDRIQLSNLIASQVGGWLADGGLLVEVRWGSASVVFASDPTEEQKGNVDSAVAGFSGAERGSILYKGTSGWVLLPPGDPGQVLTSQGPGQSPIWATM